MFSFSSFFPSFFQWTPSLDDTRAKKLMKKNFETKFFLSKSYAGRSKTIFSFFLSNKSYSGFTTRERSLELRKQRKASACSSARRFVRETFALWMRFTKVLFAYSEKSDSRVFSFLFAFSIFLPEPIAPATVCRHRFCSPFWKFMSLIRLFDSVYTIEITDHNFWQKYKAFL